MDKDRKSEIHITNNFNAPIGQHIDHVDTINFRMDGDGTFHFGMVDNVSPTTDGQVREDRQEERFHFIHPEIEEEEAWRIHDAIKRLITNYRVPEICAYLKDQKQNGKLIQIVLIS